MPLVVQIKLERQHLLEMVAFLCSILGGGRVLSQVDTRTPPREFVAIHNSFLKCRLCRAAVGLWFKFCILEGKKSDLAILSLSQSMETKKLMLTLLGSRCAGGAMLVSRVPHPPLPARGLLTPHPACYCRLCRRSPTCPPGSASGWGPPAPPLRTRCSGRQD